MRRSRSGLLRVSYLCTDPNRKVVFVDMSGFGAINNSFISAVTEGNVSFVSTANVKRNPRICSEQSERKMRQCSRYC